MTDVLLVFVAAFLGGLLGGSMFIAVPGVILWWQECRQPDPVPAPPPLVADEAPIIAAVRRVFEAEGLPREQFDPAFDLASAGKVYAVLHHASAALHKDCELRTVQDVVDWLREAPTV